MSGKRAKALRKEAKERYYASIPMGKISGPIPTYFIYKTLKEYWSEQGRRLQSQQA